MNLILITGLSGSGKTIALRTLEDVEFFCIDNLPIELFEELVKLNKTNISFDRVAISIDIRSKFSLSKLTSMILKIKKYNVNLKVLFLETQDHVLIKRFSETRRVHPLVNDKIKTLVEAIDEERKILYQLKTMSVVLDTSNMIPDDLRNYIKTWIREDLSLLNFNITIQTFGFKYGLPIDTDFVFDVRCLPNPYYDDKLKYLTGYDKEVHDFFDKNDNVKLLLNSLSDFLKLWIEKIINSNRNGIVIAIGCTGGVHRSVFVALELEKIFSKKYNIKLRHRDLK